MEPVVASLCYYVYVVALCAACRFLLAKYAPDALRPYERALVEMIGTMQLCATVFENGVVLGHYGYVAYFVVATLVAFVNAKTKQSVANPAELADSTIAAGMPAAEFALLLLAELAGGAAAFYAAQQFWRLRATDVHTQRFEHFACRTDLNVSPVAGLLLEAAASFAAQFGSLYIYAANYGGSRHAADMIICAMCSAITVAGLSLTGMYYNPILASSLTFGCEGLDAAGHVEVYWLGPILGQVAGTRLFATGVLTP